MSTLQRHICSTIERKKEQTQFSQRASKSNTSAGKRSSVCHRSVRLALTVLGTLLNMLKQCSLTNTNLLSFVAKGKTDERMVTVGKSQAATSWGRLSLSAFFYAFLLINAFFVAFVYNVASSCSKTNEEHLPDSKNKFHIPARRISMVPKENKLSNNFAQWLKQNPNTPGSRLVMLLKKHLHPHPNAEAERLKACHDKNYPLCFAGHKEYEHSIRKAPQDKKENLIHLERTTNMPFAPSSDSEGYSVWRMRRFSPINGKLRLIHSLGTDPSCLALLLAGAAVQDFGVVVELGTYLGMGLNSTGRSDSYFAFDIFGNDDFNYDKITKAMPWTLQVMPDFKKESSYQWLWRNATYDAYPTANAFEGYINSTTLTPRMWQKKTVALLSIDSAKSWNALKSQTAGIQRPYMLKKGSILILMDFITIESHIKLFYSGCLSQYLQPVYSSYCRGEQWIFVVTKSFSLGMIGACIEDFIEDQAEPTDAQYEEMFMVAQEHVNIMSSLDFDSNKNSSLSPQFESERRCMINRLKEQIKVSPGVWKFLRVQ